MLRRSLLLAALTLVAQGALAKDWDSIRFATEGAYPPFNMVDTQGEVQGFEVDISNALCEQMKARCTWVKQEWDGMIPALLSRKFDAIAASMSITEERKKRVAFSNKFHATPLASLASFPQKILEIYDKPPETYGQFLETYGRFPESAVLLLQINHEYPQMKARYSSH